MSEKAAQDLTNQIILKSMTADIQPDKAARLAVIYTQLAVMWMALHERDVSSWKVGLLGSKSDALAMRAIASIVSYAINHGEPLPHVSVLRDTYELYAARTPKACDYIDPIRWDDVA